MHCAVLFTAPLIAMTRYVFCLNGVIASEELLYHEDTLEKRAIY